VLGLLVTADRALGSSHVEDTASTRHRPRSFDDASIPMAPTDEDVVAADLAKLDVTAAAGGADGGDNDDEASGDEAAATADGTPSAAAKKKKKKKKKKKTGGGGGGGAAGSGAAGQTAPPTVPVSHLFNNVFPEGEIQHYKDDNVWRVTSEEKRELERLEKNMYNEVRQCSEVHREVRRYISDWVKPGMKLIDVCGAFIFTISVIKRMGYQSETDVLFCSTLTETLENSVRRLIEERGLEAGIAFPTGCSQNHIAAHWTPNGGDNTIIDKDDVIKFDFGTQINGACQATLSSTSSLFIFPLFLSSLSSLLFILLKYGQLHRPHHRLRVYKDVQR